MGRPMKVGDKVKTRNEINTTFRDAQGRWITEVDADSGESGYVLEVYNDGCYEVQFHRSSSKCHTDELEPINAGPVHC